MSRYSRCKECYNMDCIFVTGEREDIDTSECADFRPFTNADRIRGMTDEELAGWFDKLTNGCDLCPIRRDCELGVESFGRCDDKWLAWLRSTADKDGES